MAIALVEQILTSQSRKDEESLLNELHKILIETQSTTAAAATTASQKHRRNSEIMAKHCKQLGR